MGIGSWLVALVGPIVGRVLKSLGLALVTYAGVNIAVTSILDGARTAWAGNQLADVAQLVAMAGANTAMSIIAGAFVARLTFTVLKRFEPK